MSDFINSANQGQRIRELFESDLRKIQERIDRFFSILLCVEVIGCVLTAFWVSPHSWIGNQRQIHPHVWASICLGSVIASLPIAFAVLIPGWTITRHVVAAGQMAISALLIHVTGGRIETHFHIFGSFAFLAFYRDRAVLITGMMVVAIDHAVRGIFWPESVYGTPVIDHWRTFEHIWWVVFENIFLIYKCYINRAEMQKSAERTVQLEMLNTSVEQTVESRTAELQIEREKSVTADRAKSEFLANMSHEIRTPMTAILGNADILLEEGDISRAPALRVEVINTIRRNANHLLGIINDILDLSKIEAGRMTVERIACSPQEIVEEVAGLLRSRANSKGIDLLCKFDPALPQFVAGDPTRLRQILLNLTSNAVKFTLHGKVVVSAGYRADEGILEINVADSGIGMSPQEIQQLFLPFVQADSSTTRTFGGTGLGLTICKRLAKLMGGDVSVVSSRPGTGTVFRFEVTAPEVSGKTERTEAAADVANVTTTSSLCGKKILVAEDGLDNQKIIVFMLKRWKADVVLVDNGALAVEAAQQAADSGKPFDAILMDMQMPVLDGYGATRALRNRGYQYPIVALTAHAMSGDRDNCLEAGCDDYLVKPIDRNLLLQAILRSASQKSQLVAAR
jgi:signal transduction histidine kinase/ActR/RegA family two-component response regulator